MCNAVAAVWMPGLYQVRDFARHVEGFMASSGITSLAWAKSRKNRWRIETGGAQHVTIKYKVYANELNSEGNFVDAGFAMLNGAPNFVTIAGRENRPHEVKLELPAAWRKSISGMKRKMGEAHTYLAANFDELVDCPIYAGNAPFHEFEVMDKIITW